MTAVVGSIVFPGDSWPGSSNFGSRKYRTPGQGMNTLLSDPVAVKIPRKRSILLVRLVKALPSITAMYSKYLEHAATVQTIELHHAQRTMQITFRLL